MGLLLLERLDSVEDLLGVGLVLGHAFLLELLLLQLSLVDLLESIRVLGLLRLGQLFSGLSRLAKLLSFLLGLFNDDVDELDLVLESLFHTSVEGGSDLLLLLGLRLGPSLHGS